MSLGGTVIEDLSLGRVLARVRISAVSKCVPWRRGVLALGRLTPAWAVTDGRACFWKLLHDLAACR